MALTVVIAVMVLWQPVHQWWIVRSVIKNLLAAELHNDANKRVDTYKKLTAIGPPAVAALLKLMRHANDDVRFEAITPLALIKSGVDDAIPVMIEVSRHDQAKN